MSLSSKNTKNIKIQYQKESSETLAPWDIKPQVGNLNIIQTTGG